MESEIGVALKIGHELIEQMKKQFPKIGIGEPYKGKYVPYIKEYVNTFIKEDLISNDLDDADKSDLWQEVTFIECFCKWLEEEKGVVPK